MINDKKKSTTPKTMGFFTKDIDTDNAPNIHETLATAKANPNVNIANINGADSGKVSNITKKGDE